MSKICLECGHRFDRPYNYSQKQWSSRRFCSNKCSTVYRLRVGKLVPFKKGHKHSLNTKKKLSQAKIGELNPNWKGGRHLGDKYYFRVRIAPKTYKKEHRLIMEKHIGRELLSNEHVHHINGIKTDNRIENLVVLTKSEHHKIHNRWTKGKYGKLV